jgi:hypothetical protein
MNEEKDLPEGEEKDLPEGEEKDWSELRPVRIMVGEEEEKLLGGTVTVMVEEDEIALGGPVTVRPDEEKGLPEDKQLVHDTKAESGCAMPFDAQE